jgi:hypothetical protein
VVGDKWNLKVEGDEEDVVVEDEVAVDDADTDTDTEAGLFHVVNPDQRSPMTWERDGNGYNLWMLRRVQMLVKKHVSDSWDHWTWSLLIGTPVTFDKILEVIKYRAAQANDKYGRHWYKEHIVAYFVCLLGATQFKVDTDLWNKESKVMLPAPNFGKYLSLDRFKRIARYLAKGPATYNGQAMDDEVNTDAYMGAISVVIGWFQSG